MDYKFLVVCILLTITELHGKERKSSKASSELIDQEEPAAAEKNVVRQKRGHLDIGHQYKIQVIRKPKKTKTKKIHIINMDPSSEQQKFEESKIHHTFAETHERVEDTHPVEYGHKYDSLNFEFPKKEGGDFNADGHLLEGTEHHHVEQTHHEPMKVKHHHHHHHHVKTIIKKVPHPVEKVVHVPKPYPVEKIVEKVVHVPVEKVVHVPKPYPVEKVVEKIIHVPVEKIVHVPKPYPVEKIVHVPVEKIVKVHVPMEKIVHIPIERIVKVPVEKIVTKTVPVEKIVEKIVHVPKPYPVFKPVPYPVEVKVPVHIPHPYPVEKKVPIPFPVEKKVPYPVKVEVEKKAPVPVKVYMSHPESPKFEHHHSSEESNHGDENHSYGSYYHDFSSQDSRVHSVKVPKESRLTKQQQPELQSIAPKPLLPRVPEYQVQRPQQEAPLALEIKSHLEDRRPQVFPALAQESQPVQQVAPQPRPQPGPQRNLQQEHFDHMQSNHQNYQYNYHPGVRQHVIQGAGSEIQSSIALPEHIPPAGHIQQGGNLMVDASETLPQPMALVQQIAPVALPHISIQLVPVQQHTDKAHSNVNTYPDPNQY